MKLLADENIPDELIDLLRKKGYDVVSVPPRAKDSEIAILAKKSRRILLTQDKDFANIILYPPKTLHGIIRIKIHPPVISDMLSALEDLLQKFSQQELDRKLFILEEDGFRMR